MYGKIAIWERWVASTIVLPKSALRKRSRCYWETSQTSKGNMSKGNMRLLELTIKDKKIWKTHLLLRILAVIGRYGSHLMIVRIFLTSNNFLNGPGISDRLLGFYYGLVHRGDCINCETCYFCFDLAESWARRLSSETLSGSLCVHPNWPVMRVSSGN